jgi:ubiquinone biosynthesis UbiH/UbiF/VisC/COQ6 family hydroxylase
VTFAATFGMAVVGGGPVGLALAQAARNLPVALVSKAGAPPVPAEDGSFDARVYALSPGNVEFLRGLGAWDALPRERVTPIHAMEIFGDRGDSALEFDAYRAGVPALAWTVEDGALQRALWKSLEARAHVKAFVPAEPERLECRADGALLQLRGGERIEAALVVGADGSRSFVRQAAGITVMEKDYGQTAVVANFATERPHGQVALQWFQGGPVLALLPLPGRRVSMIWSLPARRAAELLELDAPALCRDVERASLGRLGQFSLLGAPASYPLHRLLARRSCAARVALVGDAAHVIHPLAGQGLNLGLQDARALARVLAERDPVLDPGDAALLRRYERRRAEPTMAMAAAVDGLHGLFGAQAPAAAFARNAGLNLVTRIPVLKNLLMRHAMS